LLKLARSRIRWVTLADFLTLRLNKCDTVKEGTLAKLVKVMDYLLVDGYMRER